MEKGSFVVFKETLVYNTQDPYAQLAVIGSTARGTLPCTQGSTALCGGDPKGKHFLSNQTTVL